MLLLRLQLLVPLLLVLLLFGEFSFALNPCYARYLHGPYFRSIRPFQSHPNHVLMWFGRGDYSITLKSYNTAWALFNLNTGKVEKIICSYDTQRKQLNDKGYDRFATGHYTFDNRRYDDDDPYYFIEVDVLE